MDSFDLEEGLRRGVYIAGQRGSGKTLYAQSIVDYMMNNNVHVIVFDNSEAWLSSSLPQYISIDDPDIELIVPDKDSVLYEMPLLYLEQQKEIIRDLMSDIFMRQVRTPKGEREWIVFVLEEAQTMIPQGRLKSIEAQEMLRVITVGRNYKVSYIMITQDSASVDKAGIRGCGQKYLGRADEMYTLRYLGEWLGKRTTELPDLKVGEFLYQHGREIQKIKVPEFKAREMPKLLVDEGNEEY